MPNLIPVRQPVKAPPNPEITFFLSLSPEGQRAACRGQNPLSSAARAYKAASVAGLSHDIIMNRLVELQLGAF
jgi:hypothetical protein